MATVLMLAIPLAAGSLYWALGNYQSVSHSDELNTASSEAPNPEVINKMVIGLAEKLKTEPNNLEGWLMLGRSYKVLERYPDAVAAFAHVYQLAGDKAEVMLPYAEALALANDNNWAGKPYELIRKALTIEPDNLTGLWFSAMATAQQGDKKSAIGFLRKLEALLPEESPDKQQLHELIASTEGQLGNATSAISAQSDAPSAASVDIQVSLATELQAVVSPEDTVFIYAQALSGPKMPLAIIRKVASELPLSVSLTDAESMLPNMKLSSFKQVRLLARISKSGNAMPQPGDLIGIIGQANLVGHRPYKIVISDRIK
jgi:cytochrome c-type biogenesis protein CcmH